MHYLDYHENRPRGTYDFPFEFHHLDESSPRYTMPYHWHVEYEIVRILRGSLRLSLDGQELTGAEGDVFFIGSGILHSGIPQDCIYECIVFDMNTFLKYNDACKKMIQNIIDHSVLVFHHFKSDIQNIRKIVWNIFNALAVSQEGYQMTVLGGFYQFFGTIYEKHLYLTDSRQTSRDHKRIMQLKKALEWIENNYSRAVSLAEFSKSANMSAKYFCRFFHEMTHTTPINYINRFRIEHACHLILTTHLPMTEIALNCGFSDLSYFIKLFKRYKGVTPKKYLK